MKRFPIPLLLFVVIACASAPPADDRISVTASLSSAAEAKESVSLMGRSRGGGVYYYRVVVRNSAARPLLITRVEVQPIGGAAVRRAYVNAKETVPPDSFATFDVSTEVDDRQLARETEEIGIATVHSSSGRAGSAEARVYVTFVDGAEKVTSSYKVEL